MGIEIVKVLNQVDMNIMPFLHNALADDKFYKIQNTLIKHSLFGKERLLTHYLGKRDNEHVHYIQIDFPDHDSLYVVVETDELR